MSRKLLKKELLNKLILGVISPQEEKELLETDEVKAMMYQQWISPVNVREDKTPDFSKLFNLIKKRISLEKASYEPNPARLLSELNSLKSSYSLLKRKQLLLTRVAAVIVVILMSALITMQVINPVHKETFTENISPKGQKTRIKLPDGTNAWLNSGTILRYSNKFGNKNRIVTLEGEGYFEVASNRKIPFIINTTDIKVEVIGTSFNIMSYSEDEFIEITLEEGTVTFEIMATGEKKILHPGEKAVYNRRTSTVDILQVNALTSIAWKENLLRFDNENFSDIIQKLERWYDVKISVQGIDSIEDRFTMTIKTESLKEVLELIKHTTPIEYTIHEDDVTIKY